MNTLVRILIITAVFALVMGITYVAVNASSSAISATGPRFDDGGRFSPNGERPNFENGERPEFPGGERNELRGANGLRLFAGAIKNTVIIGVIVALIVWPKGWMRRRRREAVSG